MRTTAWLFPLLQGFVVTCAFLCGYLIGWETRGAHRK